MNQPITPLSTGTASQVFSGGNAYPPVAAAGAVMPNDIAGAIDQNRASVDRDFEASIERHRSLLHRLFPTHMDRLLQDAINRYQIGGVPRITRIVAVEPDAARG